MKVEDYNNYREFLPGIRDDSPEEFYRLAQIFSENVFELIQNDNGVSVPYMMDDAIESFIIFENPVVTGNYDKNKRELITGSIEVQPDKCILVVRQQMSGEEDSFFTIRFTGLHMENHLYRYHTIGHFWISGYEYLRQLDYRLWVIRDKYQFFGREACSDEEISLLNLYEFAPLRYYTCIDWEKDAGNECSINGIEAFISIAKKAGDKSFLNILQHYLKKQSKIYEKTLIFMLRSYKHSCIVKELQKLIDDASSIYDERSFGEKYDAFIKNCRKEINDIFPKENKVCECLEEQPFTIYDGEFSYNFHFIFWKRHFLSRNCKIYTIELHGNDIKQLKNQFQKQINEIIYQH